MRCFVALGLEPDPGPALAPQLAELRASFSGLSVPPPENLHVTLVFLGEIDAGQVEQAREAMEATAKGVSPWAINWGMGGAFPSPARPSVLWLGLGDREPTAAFRARLAANMTSLGLTVADKPFRPHLTLARVRRQIPQVIRDGVLSRLATLAPPPPAEVRAITLYQSVAQAGPPTYRPLAVTPLRIPPTDRT